MSQYGSRISSARPILGTLGWTLLPMAFFAGGVMPRIHSAGTQPTDRDRPWCGDDLVTHPSFVWTNAVTIDRPADQVWPWVTQLGQGRSGLYSYDWLENALLADVHSASQVRADLQRRLEVGDRVIRMTRYAPHNPVALYQSGHALVLGGVRDTDEQLAAGHPTSTWAFIVEPVTDRQCRLIIRSRASGLDARVQGPIQFVMQHKMMLGIKQRAEGTWTPSGGDVAVPMSWFAAAAVAALHAIRALRSGQRKETALAGLASVVVQALLFWDVPPATRTALLGALVGSALPPLGGGQ